MLLIFGVELIRVYLRLSRSNVRFLGVARTINHQELAEVIGTGFICGLRNTIQDQGFSVLFSVCFRVFPWLIGLYRRASAFIGGDHGGMMDDFLGALASWRFNCCF